MPITNVNRSGNDSSANRTTFRPPWVKSAAEPTATPAQPSWVKKKTLDPATPAADAAPSTSTTKPSANKTQTKQSATPSKTTTIGSKASPEAATKDTAASFGTAPKKTTTIAKPAPAAAAKKEYVPSPSNPVQKDAKLQSREVKVPVMTERRQSQPHAPLKPVLKKTPLKKVESSSSEEEETDEEEEEYTDEEVEEEEEMDEEMAEMERLLEEARKEASKKARDDRMKKELAEKAKAEKMMVKLKPVLKKTPTIEEMPKEKPKSFLETPKLRKVVKSTEEILETKSAKPKLEMPTLKKVVKKDSPVVVKAEPDWKSETVLQPVKNVPPPPPPPLNGAPPPPPPPPGMSVAEKKALSDKQKHTLEKLKSRPRRRPDWSDMMAEVEQGRKLKHVQCNDRSQPILTCKSMAKVDGQFIFETEKDEKASKHNEMLKEIQFGVRLKSVKTNDRSKPDLSGLRKFRKQMTIEEQIKKSESRATMPVDAPVESDEDELDDIDRLRDDLQSTKQMLSQELRNKEAQERENKRLMAKIQQMEAELEREKSKSGGGGDSSAATTNASSSSSGSDEALVKALKQEAAEAQKTSKDLEKKYNTIAEQLDAAKSDIEEKNRKIAALEKQLSQVAAMWDSDEDSVSNYHLQRARSKGPGGYGNRRASEAVTRDSSPEPEPEVSEDEEEEDEEKKRERKKRRVAREVRVMRSKLTRLKEKEMVAKQERDALKMAKKTQQLIMKEEKKKYKALQKEVSKMAKLMAEEADDEDEDEEEKKPPKEEEASEASEDEDSDDSESDDSGSDEESESESENEDATEEAKQRNLDPRVKRHEGILAALKKSNVLHQANMDRVKDEINTQRDMCDQLQHDLDSVLSELG